VKCSSCGALNEADAVFCEGACGTSFGRRSGERWCRQACGLIAQPCSAAYGAASLAIGPAESSELLFERANLQFHGPGASILMGEMPVRLRNRVRIEHVLFLEADVSARYVD
jgi:hypothetical protein